MKEKFYGYLSIFLICATLMAGVFLVNRYLIDRDRGSDDEIEVEDTADVLKPEDVDLRINYSGRFTTNRIIPVKIEGDPPGSEVTWFVDDVEYDYGKKIWVSFPESNYYRLRANVKWDIFEMNVSERIAVKNDDDIGSLGYWGWYLEPDWTPTGFGIEIDRGITVPTLWINASLAVANGSMNYTLSLGPPGYEEIDEYLENVSFNETIGTFNISRFFDREFFKERERYEEYTIWIVVDVYGSREVSGNMKVSYELRY